MTNQALSISFNGRQRNIPIGLVPIVDDPMRALLGEILKDSPPPTSLTALGERVKDLSELKDLLVFAKANPNRDKVLGGLPTLLLAVLVGATVLGFMINAIAGVVILVLTLAFLLVCHSLATSLGQSDKQEEVDKPLAMYPLGVLSSPFILSNLLLTRTSSLQTKSEACEKEIQSHASEAFEYWSKNSASLAKRIKTLENRVEESLSAVQTQPVRSPQGEKDLTTYKELLARTRAEIEKAQQMTKT